MDAVRKPERNDAYISVPEAVRQLNRARSTVLGLIVAGELEGKWVAGRTVVTKASVEHYKSRTRIGQGDVPEG